MAGKADIKAVIMLVIVDIIALSMTGTVADAVAGAVAGGNVTGASATLLPIVTLLYVVCIIGANVAVVYQMFK